MAWSEATRRPVPAQSPDAPPAPAHDRAAHDRAAHDRAAHDRAAHDHADHDHADHDHGHHHPHPHDPDPTDRSNVPDLSAIANPADYPDPATLPELTASFLSLPSVREAIAHPVPGHSRPEACPAVVLHGLTLRAEGEALPDDVLRERLCTELLREAARQDGLLPENHRPDDPAIPDEATCAAIEQYLDAHVQVADPDDDTARRWFEAHPERYGPGERLHLRHILFACKPGTSLPALQQKAANTLVEVRTAEPGSDAFGDCARRFSNCPTGAEGGDLGWLDARSCLPEFAHAVFSHAGSGVIERLVRSRHGLHIVEILAREAAPTLHWEAVAGPVRHDVRHHAWGLAVQDLLRRLAAPHHDTMQFLFEPDLTT